MTPKEYWKECILDAASECGASLTDEQAAWIGEAVQGASENYGMAFYQPDSPYPSEIKKLEAALKAERDKVHCKACGGSGRIITYGGTLQFNSGCFRCHGEGKHAP